MPLVGGIKTDARQSLADLLWLGDWRGSTPRAMRFTGAAAPQAQSALPSPR